MAKWAMHCGDVARAEGLGDQRHVGAEAALHEMVHAFAALGLSDNEGKHEVAVERGAALADGLRRDDEGGEASLHVLNAVTVEPVTFHPGRPRVPIPAARHGIDVEMAVEHQALAAAGTLERGDDLESARLHLVEFHLVAPGAEPFREVAR
jgi:hypothetical protein